MRNPTKSDIAWMEYDRAKQHKYLWREGEKMADETNNKTQHTQGPWESREGVVKYETHIVSPMSDGSPNTVLVATVYHAETPTGEANARLIAATLDLLAGCKVLLGQYEDTYGDGYCECDSPVGVTCNACRARAAINKAEEG